MSTKTDQPPEAETSSTPPRQWLFDRINGPSKYGNNHPPAALCRVPPPVGWCPSVLEENLFCKTWGRIGIISPENEKARFWILHIGFAANVLGFLLTLYSCLSISNKYGLLKAASFSWGTLSVDGSNRFVGQEFEIHMGLRATALNLPNRDPWVATFDETCELALDSIAEYIQEDGTLCSGCKEVSMGMVISTVISVVTFIPSFSTDILRMHSNYDVNCQKAFSTIFALFTIALSLNTLLSYKEHCFGTFFEGEVPFDENYEIILDPAIEQPTYAVNFEWNMGPGLASLLAGTVLKVVDVLCNVVIPTPSITRDRKEQEDYEAMPEKNQNNGEGGQEEE